MGESWLRRWDSLRLFTPVRYNSLPGLPFPGEPYALPVKDDVARYLEAYVAHFALPVRLNTRVSSLVKDADRFVVMTDGDTFTARSVIVATGAYHRASIPAFASDFSPSLVQRHSSEYRNPGAPAPRRRTCARGRAYDCLVYRVSSRFQMDSTTGVPTRRLSDHRRGIVAAAPGLGFVGLRYQSRIGSSLLGGVRKDAEYSRPAAVLGHLTRKGRRR